TASEPALLVETSHDLPLVSVSVAFRMGALEDPEGGEGSVRLLGRLMRRSAAGRSAEQNDALIEGMGAGLGADVSASTITFHGTVIARSLDRFGEFLVDAIARPALPGDELERLKRETLAELVETLDDDRSLARRWFRRTLFAGHPYARSAAGTRAGVEGATIERLRGLYARLITRENLVIALSGDVSAERAARFVATLSEALTRGEALVDRTPEPSVSAGRHLVFVDKPERTQTQIIIGGLGSHPRDPDHFALAVANTAFGGTFTARLMQEVRVKRGWSYGAYSSLPYDRRRQAFSMWTFPKASDAPACIKLELELLEAFRKTGLKKSELSWAKRYLVCSHAFAVDTAAKRVGLKLDATLYELPDNYYEQYTAALNAVTLEQANQAVAARLSDENLLVTVVGTEDNVGKDVRDAVANLASAKSIRYDSD
ncbi:MAG TPA: pitrilysin family protein, partial [Polyangiaceae bacterium]|nr:pitrilysin family protein [Polyangiaceae bacterium]